MPEAEKKKLVAGLLAGEKSPLNPGGSDLKTLAKHVNSAYQKNLNMTKKKARSILTGKTNCTPVFSSFAYTLKHVCVWQVKVYIIFFLYLKSIFLLNNKVQKFNL